MDGKATNSRWGDKKRIVIVGVILVLLISSIIFFLSSKYSKPSGKILYVNTNGSGDFNCDGIDDQVEINQALADVAENPEFIAVYLRGPNTYVISDSIYIGSNTILEGDSTAVIKLKDKAGWKEEKPLITQMDSAGNQDITIKGFEIDGNHDNNSDKSNGKGYYNLMYFVNSQNIKVHDMYMHDSHGDGL
ncbi:MAG: hypothetical protein EHM20_15835, partial [Alphaproteobacteria bacterium]